MEDIQNAAEEAQGENINWEDVSIDKLWRNWTSCFSPCWTVSSPKDSEWFSSRFSFDIFLGSTYHYIWFGLSEHGSWQRVRQDLCLMVHTLHCYSRSNDQNRVANY